MPKWTRNIFGKGFQNLGRFWTASATPTEHSDSSNSTRHKRPFLPRPIWMARCLKASQPACVKLPTMRLCGSVTFILQSPMSFSTKPFVSSATLIGQLCSAMREVALRGMVWLNFPENPQLRGVFKGAPGTSSCSHVLTRPFVWSQRGPRMIRRGSWLEL